MINELFSTGSFSGLDMRNVNVSFFEGEIFGSRFCHENLDPNKAVVEFDVFPSDIVCVFRRCGMVNVKKHPGMTYIDCQDETLCVQADLMDWHTDSKGTPISPKDPRAFQKLGISTDPKHIVKSKDGISIIDEVTSQLGTFE